MARSHTISQYYDHQQSRQKLLPHCTLWVERVRPRQTQRCEGALRACLVQYLFACCRDCILFILKVLTTPSCDLKCICSQRSLQTAPLALVVFALGCVWVGSSNQAMDLSSWQRVETAQSLQIFFSPGEERPWKEDDCIVLEACLNFVHLVSGPTSCRK